MTNQGAGNVDENLTVDRTMSSLSLRSRIQEEHLTCTICFNVFTKPKALPCLHTFCEQCLREYIVSRGFEASGEFPCPVCRATTQIPAGGIEQFPSNHLLSSLSDTVDKKQSRPVPKPRKTLQAKVAPEDLSSAPPPPYSELVPQAPAWGASAAPASYGGGMEAGGQPQAPPPQPFHPSPYGQPPPQFEPSPFQGGYPYPPHNYPAPHYPPQSYPAPAYPPPPPTHMSTAPVPSSTTGHFSGDTAEELTVQAMKISNSPSRGDPPLYPNIPPSPTDATSPVCSQGLVLKFGKKGASVTDFHKPFGLAVSDDCDYVITDISHNRIFVFDHKGEPKKAFQCDCRIKDVAVNDKKEIFVVINKPGAALRCYDYNGRCLGEHLGKSITHEESNGIALFPQGGLVVTGKQNSNVYILTDQYKLSSKIGRKGTGDGYFQSPAFVAVDSKGHIIVSDDVNHNVQVFNNQGKFKLRFGGKGTAPGQLLQPMGVITDSNDNIIVADSGNCRVEVFSSRGTYLRTIVSGTNQLGEDVRPVNVAMTPRGNVAVLLKGNYFAEVRIFNLYTSCHDATSVKESTTSWYLVN